jgi:hypothetical protein
VRPKKNRSRVENSTQPAPSEGVARKNAALAANSGAFRHRQRHAGFVLHEDDGSIDSMAFEQHDGRIVAIYVVRSPKKIQHVSF